MSTPARKIRTRSRNSSRYQRGQPSHAGMKSLRRSHQLSHLEATNNLKRFSQATFNLTMLSDRDTVNLSNMDVVDEGILGEIPLTAFELDATRTIGSMATQKRTVFRKTPLVGLCRGSLCVMNIAIYVPSPAAGGHERT